jgi:hypothetical protein
MYYAITTGTLKRLLFDNDQRGIEFIYPCAVGQICNPGAAPTPTLTASPTPTASPTATATATATPTATPTPTPVTRIVTHADGGVVEYAQTSGSYVTLLVPPNAVVTDTVVTIEQITDAPAAPPRFSPVMQYFRVGIGPAGLEQDEAFFQQPATLTITYRPVAGNSDWADSMRFLTLDETDQSWVEIACEYATEGDNTQRVIAMIEQPSAYGLFRIDNMLYLPLTQR